MIRKAMMWLVWNVPLGRLTPWALGIALNSKPHRINK